MQRIEKFKSFCKEAPLEVRVAVAFMFVMWVALSIFDLFFFAIGFIALFVGALFTVITAIEDFSKDNK